MTDSVPPAEPAPDSAPLERLVFFSDAVFAIALTLLALELPVPEGDSSRELWHSFAANFSRNYLTFLISFLVIARFWIIHHGFFQRVTRTDRRLVELNLLYLMGIVVLPFATKVLGDVGQYAFGTVFYACSVAFIALLFAALAGYCSRAGLLRTDVPTDPPVGESVVGSLAAVGVFLLSIPVAIWQADAGKYFWLILIPASPLVTRLVLRGRPRSKVKTD